MGNLSRRAIVSRPLATCVRERQNLTLPDRALFPSGVSQKEILHGELAFTSGQWRFARAARYLTASPRRSGFDFYQLIERFAARTAEERG